MQDPRGLPDMVKLGTKPHLGRNVRVAVWVYPRWSVEGPQTGWVILIDEQ